MQASMIGRMRRSAVMPRSLSPVESAPDPQVNTGQLCRQDAGHNKTLDRSSSFNIRDKGSARPKTLEESMKKTQGLRLVMRALTTLMRRMSPHKQLGGLAMGPRSSESSRNRSGGP